MNKFMNGNTFYLAYIGGDGIKRGPASLIKTAIKFRKIRLKNLRKELKDLSTELKRLNRYLRNVDDLPC